MFFLLLGDELSNTGLIFGRCLAPNHTIAFYEHCLLPHGNLTLFATFTSVKLHSRASCSSLFPEYLLYVPVVRWLCLPVLRPYYPGYSTVVARMHACMAFNVTTLWGPRRYHCTKPPTTIIYRVYGASLATLSLSRFIIELSPHYLLYYSTTRHPVSDVNLCPVKHLGKGQPLVGSSDHAMPCPALPMPSIYGMWMLSLILETPIAYYRGLQSWCIVYLWDEPWRECNFRYDFNYHKTAIRADLYFTIRRTRISSNYFGTASPPYFRLACQVHSPRRLHADPD